MNIKDYLVPSRIVNWMGSVWFNRQLGDGDAIVLVPYSDDQLVPLRGHYDKHLIGNYPGYYTSGDHRFIAAGDGKPLYYLNGFPVVLAINPSEHAAVIEPLKSLIAHKVVDEHEFIRVDRSNEQIVSAGEAVALNDGGGQLATASENPLDINYDVDEEIYDLSPPTIVDRDTGEAIGQADGWIVDGSKAADLVPEKVSSEELKLMQQRERNAALDPVDILKYILITVAITSALWLFIMLLVLWATGAMPSLF